MSKQLDHYVNASIPECYTVLGVQLKPFSIGHYFLMKKFDCRFASDDVNTLGSLEDLLLGLAICSRTYEDFLTFVNDEHEFRKWTKYWGKMIRKQVRKEKHFNLFRRFELFGEYMKSSIVVPKYWETEYGGDSIQMGGHWSQTVYNVLMSDCNYTSTEVLNMPMSRALAEYYKFCERNGVLTLMSDSDIDIVEAKEVEVANGSTQSPN